MIDDAAMLKNCEVTGIPAQPLTAGRKLDFHHHHQE